MPTRPAFRTPFAALLAPLFALLVLAGCSKLTVENYDKLKMGMPYAEVKTLLGDPSSCTDVLAMRNCTWGDAQRSITVSFVADQVVLFNASNLR